MLNVEWPRGDSADRLYTLVWTNLLFFFCFICIFQCIKLLTVYNYIMILKNNWIDTFLIFFLIFKCWITLFLPSEFTKIFVYMFGNKILIILKNTIHNDRIETKNLILHLCSMCYIHLLICLQNQSQENNAMQFQSNNKRSYD